MFPSKEASRRHDRLAPGSRGRVSARQRLKSNDPILTRRTRHAIRCFIPERHQEKILIKQEGDGTYKINPLLYKEIERMNT